MMAQGRSAALEKLIISADDDSGGSRNTEPFGQRAKGYVSNVVRCCSQCGPLPPLTTQLSENCRFARASPTDRAELPRRADDILRGRLSGCRVR
jgi:hypothetical protein